MYLIFPSFKSHIQGYLMHRRECLEKTVKEMFFIHRNYFLRRMPQGKIVFQQLFLLSHIQIDTQSSLMGYRQLREIQIQVWQLVALGAIDTRIGWHQVPKQVMGDETPRNKMIQVIHTFL